MVNFEEIGRLVAAAGGIVSLDARAVRASVAVAAQAEPADLERPTPCGDWTLGQLLAHMAGQHDGFVAAARGQGADPAVWRPRPPGADPVAEYAAAADRVLGAFAIEGAADRDFVLPEIDPAAKFPAALAISFHFIDYVAHGWDVARTLGLDYQLEPDLLGAALAVAQAVPDDDRTRRRPGAAFAQRVPAPADARPLDQIMALLGRPPGWSADRRPG
jgi:uncharacterized protein (TIGR03086 family)